jgi:hypothetical protein
MASDWSKWKSKSDYREPWNQDRDHQWKSSWNSGWQSNYASESSSSNSQWRAQGNSGEQREHGRGKGQAVDGDKAVRKLGDGPGKAAIAVMKATEKSNDEFKASMKGGGKAAAKRA